VRSAASEKTVLKSDAAARKNVYMKLFSGLFIFYVAGVLISPSPAVHGINPDYHAVFQKRGVDSRCLLKFHGTAGSEAISYWFRYAATVIVPVELIIAPVRYFLHLTIIKTQRLLL